MKYFYDTEFLERGPSYPIELISLGVVAEDGREFLAVNSEFNLRRATPWLRRHVLPKLPPRTDPAWRTPVSIARALRRFVGKGTPEFWGYFADYDHVVLCQLFGDMEHLPKGWPMFSRDLEQLRERLGVALPARGGDDNHDALADARWIRACWLHLSSFELSANSEPNTPARRE